MDEIDRKITAHLQESGRDSYAGIGSAVGLSVSAVAERLKKLQSAGVILGFGARVDPELAGRPVLAFVFVGLDRAGEEAFLRVVGDRADILECHHVTGDWSYLLKIRVGTIREVSASVDFIKSLSPTARTHTLIALGSPKETSTIPVTGPAP